MLVFVEEEWLVFWPLRCPLVALPAVVLCFAVAEVVPARDPAVSAHIVESALGCVKMPTGAIQDLLMGMK